MPVTAEMFRKNFLKKRSLSGCQDLHYSCAVRLLDDSDVISVSFEVKNDVKKSTY